MVAQKPAGNFNPLSSFGHPWLLVSAPGRPDANELPTHNALSAAMAGKKVLNRLENRMDDILSIELISKPTRIITQSTVF
jgi:hypothetical protein